MKFFIHSPCFLGTRTTPFEIFLKIVVFSLKVVGLGTFDFYTFKNYTYKSVIFRYSTKWFFLDHHPDTFEHFFYFYTFKNYIFESVWVSVRSVPISATSSNCTFFRILESSVALKNFWIEYYYHYYYLTFWLKSSSCFLNSSQQLPRSGR